MDGILLLFLSSGNLCRMSEFRRFVLYYYRKNNFYFALTYWEIGAAMNLFSNINFITIIIICIFLMPIAVGLLNPVSKDRIRNSLLFILRSFNFIVGLILSVYLVRVVFSDQANGLLTFLDKHIPSAGNFISQYHQDIMAYMIALFILMSVIFFVLELLTIPVCRYVIIPVADKLSLSLNLMNSKGKRLFSGLWQLPKSVFMVLFFSLLLSFYASYINNPSAGDYINASKAYQAVNKNMLHPILRADLVKKMPVLVGDAFRKAAEDFTPASAGNSGDPNYWKLPAIKYFNGMTIDEAVKSNSEIDETAKQLVDNETDDIKKAHLLYKWVSKNIEYDKAKAEIVLENPSRVDSGSIITFAERTGVCFDYSCLYVSMCRAAGVKVRLVSGLGYSGIEWGEHVWNQIYDPESERWINIDTTFGSSGYDHFDNPDFSENHKYDVVQAEW